MIIHFVNTNASVSENTLKSLIKEYHDKNTSLTRKLDIRHGEGSGLKYTNNLKAKAVNKISFGRIEFWLNKGLSLEEALKQKRAYYAELNKKGTTASLKMLAENPDVKKKKYERVSKTKTQRRTIEYWVQQGCTEEQATAQIKKYSPPSHLLQSFIERHGEEIGKKLHRQTYEKQRKTKMEKYGSLMLNGYVSKASIKYFKPLYKLLRKSGILKTDILWGIGKQREFTTFDKETNKNYAFDFVIKSKKVIIEYNDAFWHARDKSEWKNPMVTYEQSQERDTNKLRVASKLGFDIIYIWSDNLPDIQTLKEQILK
jgi:very-short-patch-repair endonuclease